MQVKDPFRHAVEFSYMIAGLYIQDLEDADLVVRSVPGANHIAWQLGHLISSTGRMLEDLGQPAPPLPDGFAGRYTRQTAASDNPADFDSKAVYQDLMEQMKAASLAAIGATPEGTLDDPGPESMREYAPTVASVLMLLGTHWLMHAGQWVPVRRKLGRPANF